MKPKLRLPWMLALAASAAGLAACGDDVTDPAAFVDSAEAEAVLRSADALPALPGLIDRVSPVADGITRAGFLRAAELWTAGAALDGRAGRAQRAAAAHQTAPGLAVLLSRSDWEAARADLDAWIVTAETMLRHLALPDVQQRVRSARALLARADRSGDAAESGLLTLLAASELIETTPRYVARVLVDRADRVVSAAGAAPRDGSDPGLARAHRLKDWAGRAVEEESYLLAIQRAYYAIQLVEGR